MRARKNNSKKLTVVLLSVILVLCCTIGGTLAWLMDTTDPVTNAFTAGNVDITLKETPYDAETGEYGANLVEGQNNSYPAIPGATYEKDPTVEVVTGSEDCYLFVKFEYTENADTYLNYTSNLTTTKGWKQIDTTTANGVTTEVWYRVVKKTDTTRSFALLADLPNKSVGITLEIKSSVTNQNMDTAAAQSLTWTAYAVQFNYLKDASGEAISGDTVEAATKAWALLNPTASTT